MQLRPSYRHLAFACLALLAAAAAYGVLWWHVSSTASAVANSREELAVTAKREQLMQSIRSALEETQPQREQLRTLFLPEDALVQFISTIESLGAQSGVAITIENVTDNTDDNGVVGALGLTVSIEGRWQDVMQFVARVETLPRITSISRAQLTNANQKGVASTQWDGTLTFTVRTHAVE